MPKYELSSWIVREHLADGLANVINYSGSDFDRCDKFLQELCDLAERPSRDKTVVEQKIAMAYSWAFRNARVAGETTRTAVLAEGLATLGEPIFSWLDLMIKNEFELAIILSIQQTNTEAEIRLRAAREVIYGI